MLGPLMQKKILLPIHQTNPIERRKKPTSRSILFVCPTLKKLNVAHTKLHKSIKTQKKSVPIRNEFALFFGLSFFLPSIPATFLELFETFYSCHRIYLKLIICINFMHNFGYKT